MTAPSFGLEVPPMARYALVARALVAAGAKSQAPLLLLCHACAIHGAALERMAGWNLAQFDDARGRRRVYATLDEGCTGLVSVVYAQQNKALGDAATAGDAAAYAAAWAASSLPAPPEVPRARQREASPYLTALARVLPAVSWALSEVDPAQFLVPVGTPTATPAARSTPAAPPAWHAPAKRLIRSVARGLLDAARGVLDSERRRP